MAASAMSTLLEYRLPDISFSTIGVDRLARDTIKHEDKTGLCRLCHGIDRLSVFMQSHERGRRIQITVPNVMMHRLVVPQTLPGICI